MAGADNKNYYELLGVERGATKEQIRDAYKELARIYHPDSHYYDEVLESAGVGTGESNTFKLITQAYNTLSNEKTRSEYDQAIPANLPSWEQNQSDNWHVNHRVATSPAFNEGRVAANAYGNFGTQPHGQPKKSAFDEEHLRNLRPVSEMIRVRRSLWWKLRWLLFLER